VASGPTRPSRKRRPSSRGKLPDDLVERPYLAAEAAAHYDASGDLPDLDKEVAQRHGCSTTR
jgi:hypothetical protein